MGREVTRPPPAGDPEEEEAFVLQDGDVEAPHLVVGQRAVGQLHVDVPRRVGHHHGEFTQDADVQVADVAADPLSPRNGAWGGQGLSALGEGESKDGGFGVEDKMAELPCVGFYLFGWRTRWWSSCV